MEADAQGSAINAPSVTLLVTPQQAETLTLASTEGRVQLVLRNGSDQQLSETKGAAATELYRVASTKPAAPAVASSQPARPAVAAPPPAPPPPDEIVIFRGTERSVQVVNAGPSGD
jgi:pilus assembly protein CpaB